MPIPLGLVRCPVCGEFRGKVSGRDLNWGLEELDMDDEFDRVVFEMRLEDLASEFTVSCLCEGIPCPRCHVNKIHRPISNSYDPERNEIGHWPYFSASVPCSVCRAKEKR